MMRSIPTSLGPRLRNRGGFTLIEVLVSMAIMSAGIIAILALFPQMLEANQRAELRTKAAFLAMMKIEEVRLQNDDQDKLLNAIRNLASPTEPVVFPQEPRLAYRFSSTTILFRKVDADNNLIDDPADPRDDPGVARVIIMESPTFRANPRVIDEFRFN